jgi:hypothetical protein
VTVHGSRLAAILLAIATLAAGCGSDGPQAPSGEEAGETPSFPPVASPYEPEIDPADFVAGVDNPYLPLEPGTTYTYEGESEGERERNVVTVTSETRRILGIDCVVVKDVVWSEGKLAERTFDWYAQDRFGNVWYFGEDSKEYDHGEFKSTEGSWEAGVDGAMPGIVMLGNPIVGDPYRQEYYAGEAEDFGQVIEIEATVDVPFDSFDDVVVTKDFTPLEPNFVENKYYARGVGVVKEMAVKGAHEISVLVGIKKS